MTPKELKQHKDAPKQLNAIPVFKPQKKNKLPRPLKNIGGARIASSGMIDVSDDHVAFMFWKDGEILTDRSFFGYLFCRLRNGALSPVFEFHWHPSHKGMHCKMPCKTQNDYTNRFLPGAPELSLKTNVKLDPKIEADRIKLVNIFCAACGITLSGSDSQSLPIWS
jgi:hypothetical protein